MDRGLRFRRRRLAMGLCKYCTHPAHGGTRMCWRHRVYQALWKAAKRRQEAA